MISSTHHTNALFTDTKALLSTYPKLRVFSSYTDSELCDPKQLIGLEHNINQAASTLAIPSNNQVALGDDGIFIAESRKVIDRAFAEHYRPFAGVMDTCWVHQNHDLTILMDTHYPDVPFVILDHALIQSLTGYRTTKGPLMAFYRKPSHKPEDLLAHAHRIAIFEDINNYTNMGALFRSAAALGIDAVFITPACYDPLYRRGLRVSMGAALQVPWTRIKADTDQSWTDTFFPLLHEYEFTTFALALTDSAYPLDDPRLPKQNKCALILGNEGAGLQTQTIEQSDYTVIIPMAHAVDSLNVACASSVAFWEFMRHSSCTTINGAD